MEQYVNWFIFFTGVNLAGYGWFAVQLAENKYIAKWVIFIVCLYFAFQNLIAVFASRKFIDYLKSFQKRSIVLISEINETNIGNTKKVKIEVACPFNLYISWIKLAISTFPSMILLWVAFTIFAFVG
ncbi:MAG: hypothetical protein AAFR77_00600 [Cyanobacteria bacterium J06631_2]